MKESNLLKSIKEIVENLRNLANNNTDLFLGLGGWIAPIGVAIAAIIIYFINWALYCYYIGYYHLGYNVPISLITEPKVESLSVNILWGIIIVILLTLSSLLGQLTYRIRKFGIFFTFTVLAIAATFLFPMIPSLTVKTTADSIALIVATLIFSSLIALFLNIYSFETFFFPTEADQLARKSAKVAMLEKRICNTAPVSKKRKALIHEKEKLEEEIKILKETEKEIKEKKQLTTESKLKSIGITIAIATFLFLLTTPSMCIATGINEASRNKELTIIIGQEDLLSQYKKLETTECKVNALALIYETDGKKLIVPCYITDQIATIYTNCYQLIDSEALIRYTCSFENINTMTAVFCL